LLGGLLLARDGGVPDTHVWASAAWHPEYGIGRVEGLREKLDLAGEWGARQVFVPAQNQPEVSAWREGVQNALKVELLSPVSSSPQPSRLLAPYLEQLGTEPSVDAPFATRRAFYARVNWGRAGKFYGTHLLTDAIERCRKRLREDCPD